MSTQDPFEASQREALRSTDALLDRLGARSPTPEDLDDPVVAALALMAAEIDRDTVPVESSLAALEAVLPELRRGSVWTPGTPAAAWRDDQRSSVDLRDGHGDLEVADVLAPHRPRVAAGLPWSGEDGSLRGPRRPGRHPEHAAVAMAPPRSLTRFTPPSTRPGGPATRPGARSERQLRPLTAVVVALVAIVLGSGVSAAVTGGRSVNPLTGLQQVVAQLANGRTVDQQALFDADMQRITAATAHAQEGDGADAVRELNRVRTVGLSPEDVDHVLSQVKQVLHLLGDQ